MIVRNFSAGGEMILSVQSGFSKQEMLVSLYKSDLCGIIYKTLGAQKTWWLENRQISIILTAVQCCSVSAGALEGKNGPS